MYGVTKRLSPERVEAPENSVELSDTCFLDVQSTTTKTSVGVPWVEVLGTDGG